MMQAAPTPPIYAHHAIPWLCCRLVAQLARTEEAAKRILTRTDPAARGGGVAQRLLDLERELAHVTQAQAELGSQLGM